MDPTAFEVSDIYKTSVDPLARVMRYELKKRKVRKLKVVYSKEIPIKRRRIRKTVANTIAFALRELRENALQEGRCPAVMHLFRQQSD